jgi:hypothetical protein
MLQAWTKRIWTEFDFEDRLTADMRLRTKEVLAKDFQAKYDDCMKKWIGEAVQFLVEYSKTDMHLRQALELLLKGSLDNQQKNVEKVMHLVQQTAHKGSASKKRTSFQKVFGYVPENSDIGKEYLVSLVSQMICFEVGFGTQRFEDFLQSCGRDTKGTYDSAAADSLYFCCSSDNVLFPNFKNVEIEPDKVTSWFEEHSSIFFSSVNQVRRNISFPCDPVCKSQNCLGRSDPDSPRRLLEEVLQSLCD